MTLLFFPALPKSLWATSSAIPESWTHWAANTEAISDLTVAKFRSPNRSNPVIHNYQIYTWPQTFSKFEKRLLCKQRSHIVMWRQGQGGHHLGSQASGWKRGLSPGKKGRGDIRASDRPFHLSSLLSQCGPSLDSSSPQNTLKGHREQVSPALHIVGLTSLIAQVACTSLMDSFGWQYLDPSLQHLLVL